MCTISKEEAWIRILRGYISEGNKKKRAVLIPGLGAEESVLREDWCKKMGIKKNED
jgi:hypothetical protein